MNSRTIGFLGAATLLIVVGALAVKTSQTVSVSDTVIGAPFFPGLEQRANEVASIEIVKGSTKITLNRSGEQWVIQERANFPADVEHIRKLVLAMIGLKSVESKTSKPDQYEKLGVEDPSGAEAAGVGVTLKDASGAVIAALVVGSEYEGTDPTKKMIYARRLSEAQSWLVEGAIEVPGKTADWILKDRVVDIFRSRIKSMKIVLPSGPQYLIARDKADAKAFRYAPLPPGMTIRSQARLDDMAAALEHVVPNDVVAASAVAKTATDIGHAEYQTFDGVVVKAEIRKGEEDWVVAYTASLADPQKASEDAKKEVQKLQTLTTWAFVLPDAKVNLMMKPVDDVLVKGSK